MSFLGEVVAAIATQPYVGKVVRLLPCIFRQVTPKINELLLGFTLRPAVRQNELRFISSNEVCY